MFDADDLMLLIWLAGPLAALAIFALVIAAIYA